MPDARDIADELTGNAVKLQLGSTVNDPTDPIGRLLFTALSMVAEFEADLNRMRTREGMAVAKAKARGQAGEHTPGELAELFQVGRSTVHRTIRRSDT